MSETLLMSIGASMFGLTVWAVLLTAYASGRDASRKDLAFGNRAPGQFPTGEFAPQPGYTRVEPPRSGTEDAGSPED
ncbi:MAG: hypothetical protein ACJZ57_07130 [Candidatus Poriferisodalaceae bacterium]|nr:MAG: hypothetical protein CNE88_06180 [Acidimicrobiales bacterium MED-G01]